MVDDGRGPLEGVDLRQQRRVDQSRCLKQLLVGPGRIFSREAVANRVVLEAEQVVHQAEPDPHVSVDAGLVEALVV